MLMAVVIELHEHIFKQGVIFMFTADDRLIFKNQTKIK
jgi:copper(I)-binding protein